MRHALLIRPAASDDDRADFSGTFVAHDPGAPALLLGDLAAQRGDGVFETVGVVDGVPHQVDAHVARLAHSAALCDLPAPNLDQWRQAIAAAAALCWSRSVGSVSCTAVSRHCMAVYIRSAAASSVDASVSPEYRVASESAVSASVVAMAWTIMLLSTDGG